VTGLQPLPGQDRGALEADLARAEEVASHDRSNMWKVSQFMTDPARYEAFIAMYAVMRVVDDLVDALPASRGLDPALRASTLETLAAWESRISAALRGAPAEEPLDRALAAASMQFPLSPTLWTNFVSAMRRDVDHDRFEDDRVFLEYAEGATAAPTTIYLYLLASQPGEDGRYLIAPRQDGFDLLTCGRDLGVFAYMAHILRDIADDLRLGDRGRIYLPLSDLASCGLTEEDFTATGLGRPPDARWDRLVERVAARARARRDAGSRAARARYPAMAPDCRFILALIIGTYSRLLDRIAEEPRSMLGGGGIPLDQAGLAADAAREAGYSPSPGGA